MPTVLLVEDDDSIRDIAQTSLELIGGWEVIAAVNGADGVEMARRHLPDAVLMDVMMPGMDGVTAITKLRSEAVTAAIPMILLTAKAQRSDSKDWIGLQLAGVITKPFDPISLPATVARLLGWGVPG